jgi:hypothetical protein
MIDDMASLKQAMEQMDADDVTVSQAGKDRAAQILGKSGLSFSKLAEMIEQRRLLLRPKIVASIKRMDQPDMLGDAAFRDTGISLRREGQSFLQIADAIELNGKLVPPNEEPAKTHELLYPMEMEGERDPPGWLLFLNLLARIVFFPLRHPIRFLTIAPLAVLLLYALRGPGTVGQQISHYFANVSAARQSSDAAMSSIGSFVEKQILRRSRDSTTAPASPTPTASPSMAGSPAAVPSTDPSSAPALPAPVPAPSQAPAASAASAAPVPSPAAPAAPSASPPGLDARDTPPSNPAANDRLRTARPRNSADMTPAGFTRNSRVAGPCVGGVGGCYWGGGHY